ncbi:oligosaccharide flippase family protein [Bacillus thermotolerans]|uniref:oligosaccharide flippase family protein n=1 Tax=Bacillus thermotolerans TaxID=1221996 RepID=UPI00057E25AA|nr:polysaccharide biosynthesis C-terminal domain-containing protein [Bacillus thermotolerans]KKB35463.1 Polysaccharide biosynthesis protein [Bacillus thermotolerans]
MLRHLLNYAPSKIVPGLINLLSIALYARIFSREEYGSYSYVLAFVMLFHMLFFSWLRLSAFRFYQSYKNKQLFFEKYTLRLFTITALLTAIPWLVIIVYFFDHNEYKILFILGLPLLIILSLFEQIMSLTRAKLNSGIFAVFSIIKAGLTLLIVILLVKLEGLGEEAIFIGMIISNFALVVYYFIRFPDVFYREKINKDVLDLMQRKLNTEFFKYGIPLTFTFILSFVLTTSDRILIEYFSNSKKLAEYSLGYDLSSFLVTNIFMILNFAYLPIIIRELEHKNLKLFARRLEEYFSLLMIGVVPIVLFVVIYAESLVAIGLGEQYNNEATIQTLQLSAVAAFIAGIKSYYFDFSFQLSKETKLQVVPVFFAAIINIILNFVLIPRLDIQGALIATVASYFLALCLSIIIGRSVFKIPPHFLDLFKVSLICLIMYLLFDFALGGLSLFWSMILFFITFIVLSYIANVTGLRKICKFVFNKKL